MAHEKVRAPAASPDPRPEIVAACDRLIAERLRPTWLPEIRPTPHVYPVDIVGRMRGDSYAFAVRFRSGRPEDAGAEHDAPFARIQHRNGLYFVHWMRHTGRWWLLHSDLTLDEAIDTVAQDPTLRPPV